jgi:hypothetical protein
MRDCRDAKAMAQTLRGALLNRNISIHHSDRLGYRGGCYSIGEEEPVRKPGERLTSESVECCRGADA